MQNKKEPYESVYFVSTPPATQLLRHSSAVGNICLNAAVLSRKILVRAKYLIGTLYWQILNIK